MRGLLVAASVLLVVLSVRGRVLAQATADEQRSVASDGEAAETRMLLSLSTGTALALGSLAIGGVVLATEQTNAARKAGAFTIVSGLALAPIVSHAIAGEWGRAALFGVLPVAGATAAIVVIESAPVLQGHGVLSQRRFLTACYTITLLSAAIGLYDSLNAAERARERQIAIAPWFERGGVGAWVGGAL